MVSAMDVSKLPLLVTLDVLLRERSVRETGRVLGLSPSSVSRHLGQLRALLDDPLLVRVGNVMVPTERAQAVSAELAPRLRDLGRLLTTRPAFEPSTAQTRFVVATSDATLPTFMPTLLDRLAATAPGVTLQLTSSVGSAEGPGQSLASGVLDLYLGPPLGPAEGLFQKKLFDLRFVCVARRGHPGIGEALDLDSFCRLRHAIVSSRFPSKSWVDEALARLGRTRSVVLTSPYFLGTAHAVAATDLVATLPEGPARAVAQALNLAIFDVPVALSPVPFLMQWHERTRHAADHAWLRETVEAAASDGDRRPAP